MSPQKVKGKMTGKQLQKLLDAHGFSQRGTARRLGIGERTMRRYVAGDLPVPPLVEFAVHALILTSADPAKAAQAVPPSEVGQVREDMAELREWLAEFREALEAQAKAKK
jgi:transcriptional regulator with XRE-family HTH domain